MLLQSDSRRQIADSRIVVLLLSAICYLLSPSCTPQPPPHLQLQIAGQVIDRQLREIVVTVINDGATPLYGFPVEIDLPANLTIIRESHEVGLELRSTRDGVYRYMVAQLAPNEHVTARFPFRREASAALAGADIRVVAANIEARRALSE